MKVLTCLMVAMVLLMASCGGDSGTRPPEMDQVTMGVPGPAGPMGLTGPQGVPGEPGESCAVPPLTIQLQNDWIEADYKRETCIHYAEFVYHDCVQATGVDQCEEGEECGCLWASHYVLVRCYDEWVRATNARAYKQCGAVVFRFSPTSDFRWIEMQVNETDDTDGDGLADGEEWRLMLNPCTEFSYGDCNLPDDQLDEDDDGLPNIDDPEPLCPSPGTVSNMFSMDCTLPDPPARVD